MYRLVEFLERAIERGGLAAAGRAGHQHHAMRVMNEAAHADQQVHRQTKLFEIENPGRLVEQAHHRRLTVLHR